MWDSERSGGREIIKERWNCVAAAGEGRTVEITVYIAVAIILVVRSFRVTAYI